MPDPTLPDSDTASDAVKALTASIQAQESSLIAALERASTKLGAKRVHVLRVTLRRLLSALELAAVIDSGARARFRRRLAKLLRRLSPLRDVQVQRREVARWAGLLGLDMSELLARLHRRQRRLIRKVRRRVRELDTEAVRHELGAAIAALGSVPTDASTRVAIRAAVHGHLARLLLRVEVRRRKTLGHETDQPRALHRLRLALKTYRYALDAALSTLPATAQELARTGARLQEALGGAHDAHLLVEIVRRELDAPTSRRSFEELNRQLERSCDEAQLAATTALREARLEWPLP